MVLILVGAKAIRFSVNTALEKNNCKILLLPYLHWKIFPPWELTFFLGGGGAEAEESLLSDREILGTRIRTKAHDSLTAYQSVYVKK